MKGKRLKKFKTSIMSAEYDSHTKKRVLPPWMKLCETATKEGQDESQFKKSRETRIQEAAGSFDKILNDSLREMHFSGSLIYSHHKSDCNLLCEELNTTLTDVDGPSFVGFDMEWPVSYRPGRQEKTAVLQLCTSADKCDIFHLSCIGGIPPVLGQLLSSPRVRKVGVGIQSDFWKLERDYGLSVAPILKSCVVDLSHYANQVLGSKETWSLDGLVKHLFQRKINKNPIVRKSDWSEFPLTDIQKSYAATDAYVSYLIYEKLNKMDGNSGKSNKD